MMKKREGMEERKKLRRGRGRDANGREIRKRGKERREGGVEREEIVRGEILVKGGGGEEDIKRDVRSLDPQAPRGESQAI